MHEVTLNKWKDFPSLINQLGIDYGKEWKAPNDGAYVSFKGKTLYRGQRNSEWSLQTTLERQIEISGLDSYRTPQDLASYVRFASRAAAEVSALTDKSWMKTASTAEVPVLGNLETQLSFLLYMRHHGYPSPLLDWTASPYIAAFFAYIDTSEADAAIYCLYRKQPEAFPIPTPLHRNFSPTITHLGGNISTHRRHFLQQSSYTICTSWSNYQEHVFAHHQSVNSDASIEHDTLLKIILPQRQRKEALTHLFQLNLTPFALMQSEESLVRTISERHFTIGTDDA